jgi:hypothetical protein
MDLNIFPSIMVYHTLKVATVLWWPFHYMENDGRIINNGMKWRIGKNIWMIS